MLLLTASQSSSRRVTEDTFESDMNVAPQSIIERGKPGASVLLIEHGKSVKPVLAALNSKGYQTAVRNISMDAPASLEHVDLILLNFDLSEFDGLKILAEIRRSSSAPILVYSWKADVVSTVSALEAGADDYMVQPIRFPELLARLNAIHRRTFTRPPEEMVSVGDIEIYLESRMVKVAGRRVRLTHTEFEILAVLARQVGSVVGRETIMREVWNRANLATSRTLHVHMVAIRGKLARSGQLVTVRGLGYRLGS